MNDITSPSRDLDEERPDPEVMDPREFQRRGYLAEVNRRVLHLLGLALFVDLGDDLAGDVLGVYDDRSDPEGWYFGDHIIGAVAAKAADVQAEWEERRPARESALGWMVQPVDGEPGFHG